MNIHGEVAEGVVLKAHEASWWAPVPILREYLGRNPRYLRTIDPIALEQVVYDVFKDFFDCEMHWTGRGADGGYDLVHVQRGTGETALYQVKRRRRSSKKESVAVVRELLGVLLVRDVTTGIVVTTASGFTRVAEQEAVSSSISQRGITLKLIDYGKLLDILRATLPKNPAPWIRKIRDDSERFSRVTADIVHEI